MVILSNGKEYDSSGPHNNRIYWFGIGPNGEMYERYPFPSGSRHYSFATRVQIWLLFSNARVSYAHLSKKRYISGPFRNKNGQLKVYNLKKLDALLKIWRDRMHRLRLILDDMFEAAYEEYDN